MIEICKKLLYKNSLTSVEASQNSSTRPYGIARMDNIEVLREKLDQLRVEHRDLDGVISQMQAERSFDQLQLARLKKRKLEIKTQIASLESKLIPDITA